MNLYVCTNRRAAGIDSAIVCAGGPEGARSLFIGDRREHGEPLARNDIDVRLIPSDEKRLVLSFQE